MKVVSSSLAALAAQIQPAHIGLSVFGLVRCSTRAREHGHCALVTNAWWKVERTEIVGRPCVGLRRCVRSWEDSDSASSVLHHVDSRRRRVHRTEFALVYLVCGSSWWIARGKYGGCAFSHIGDPGCISLAGVERAEVALGIERTSCVWVVRTGTVVLVTVGVEHHAASVGTACSIVAVMRNRCPVFSRLPVIFKRTYTRPGATVRVCAP